LPGWLRAYQPGLFNPKDVAAAQDHRSLNYVLQLTDISGPSDDRELLPSGVNQVILGIIPMLVMWMVRLTVSVPSARAITS
jgi:hypothetical protein